MLQIGSGKLFHRNVEHENLLRSVLYTNLAFNRETIIETAAGRVLPTSYGQTPKTIVYEFTELIEAQESGPGALISRTAGPYAADFAVVMAFSMNILCSPDPKLVERLTRGDRGPSIHDPPSAYIPRVFDGELWCQANDIEQLTTLASDLMALERKSFLAAMRAMRTYITALHRMADDLDLAYTLFVAALESLAQGFDGHRAGWEDFEEAKRKRLDRALKDADARRLEGCARRYSRSSIPLCSGGIAISPWSTSHQASSARRRSQSPEQSVAPPCPMPFGKPTY